MSNNAAKQRGAEKFARLPIKIAPTETPLRKPDWLRIRLPSDNKVAELKSLLRSKKLVTVCEEAACPNLAECFHHGTATFMIMGDKCTRRCSFCHIAHGRPEPLDPEEPRKVAEAAATLGLTYIVITSVDRDDLRDGGAAHFSACVRAVRTALPGAKIEILVPDFRGRVERALEALAQAPADVFNHNLETIPRLYPQARPGADFAGSLALLQAHKKRFPHLPTKSGLMLGLGETNEELIEALSALRAHDVDMLTLGQYLQPSRYHLPVARYVSPQEFIALGTTAKKMGFLRVMSGPLVRSSYHAEDLVQ